MNGRSYKGPAREAVDESAESEITIQPDGRIFAFGITATMAEVLGKLPTRDDRTRRLLGRIAGLAAHRAAPASAAEGTTS
ncbi:hypothetical protein OJF2_73110 [Aquisphaera giovannonii]|uniref:Uncharacterized protein n=1 Tax=Aquisphaera giovannonii TaxID=406548 RepID=A0A5B9WF67_9BACT|nr:hypothetical protein [Aquisphaera giovannonii]QEH38705.1 hypothetical protein OJF2_73110 [Aquisphaera giovannonii]